jgi:predicted Zn-dependent protease
MLNAFMRVTCSALLIGGAMVSMGCKVNEATGRSQLNFMSTEREIALGAEAAPNFVKTNGGEVPLPSLKQYVSTIGNRLAAISEEPELPWKFHVLNTDTINAFALPGGKVFITRGMLSKMSNEAQLAGVLGHEIGHVTAEHADERMSSAMILQGLAIGAGVAGAATDEDWLKVLGVGTQVAGTGFLLKFSRDQESESDELGVRYMTKVGYNPYGQVQVMEILKEASKGRGGTPEFLATHPLPETRIKRLNKHIQKEFPEATDPSQYMYGKENFRRNVTEPLSTLPPAPKQQPQQQRRSESIQPHNHAHAVGCCGGHHQVALRSH